MILCEIVYRKECLPCFAVGQGGALTSSTLSHPFANLTPSTSLHLFAQPLLVFLKFSSACAFGALRFFVWEFGALVPCSPLFVVVVALGCVRSLLPHHRASLAVRLLPTLGSLAGFEWSMTLGTLAQVLLTFRFHRKIRI